MTVTASVSTKGRTQSTLPLVIEAIALQTVRPKQLVIFDDNEDFKDLQPISPYSHLFPLLMSKGIQWYHFAGQRIGQVANHASVLQQADTEFVWRLDDDNVPEPDCLKNLLKIMQDPGVGAVGGLVHDPKAVAARPSFLTGKIEDIYSLNIQWYQWVGVPEEVDHLYSTFLYRVEAAKKAGGYSKNLSPVGHREETMFSHGIKRAGYKLVVTPEALTWHLREGQGGIRSYTDGSLWARDEEVFKAKLAEWGVQARESKIIVLNNGLGDHYMFKTILPEIMAAHAGKRIILATCFPEVFKDIPGIEQTSIADAITAFGKLDQWDIYAWCEIHEWKESFTDAMRKLYL